MHLKIMINRHHSPLQKDCPLKFRISLNDKSAENQKMREILSVGSVFLVANVVQTSIRIGVRVSSEHLTTDPHAHNRFSSTEHWTPIFPRLAHLLSGKYCYRVSSKLVC